MSLVAGGFDDDDWSGCPIPDWSASPKPHAALPVVEAHHRSAAWTQGRPVVLGDGSVWHLPRPDLAVLITTPGLADEVARLVRLCVEAGGHPKGSPEHIKALERHTGKTIEIGVKLLRSNYGLTDLQWCPLVGFASVDGFMDFAFEAGEAITLAIGGWLTYLAAVDPDNYPLFILN